MQQPFKVILVRFDMTGRSYSYYTDLENLEVNDHVIVHTSNTFKMARVYQIQGLSQANLAMANKMIYCKVDTEEFELKNEKLQTYLEIKNQLKIAKDQHDEMFIYKTIAKDNPEVKELLEKLDGLMNNGNVLEDKSNGKSD